MAKKKLDLDSSAVLREEQESEEESLDVEGDDTPGPEKYENLLRDLKGKDRAINRLIEQNKQLKLQAEGGVQAADLQVKAAELRAIEESLQQREKALAWALEKGVSPNLALGNSHRLAELQKELEEVYDTVRDGVLADLGMNAKKVGQKSYPKSGLTLAHLAKMSPQEIVQIPPDVLNRLQQGGKNE